MLQFFLRRLFLILFILFTISLLIFIVTEILPGDAAQMILGQQATPETVAALRARLGLDQPAYLRYIQWIGGVLRGDWGKSLVMNLPVGPILVQRLRNSLTLAVLALLIGTPLGILGGVFAGLNQGRWPDRSITVFTIFTVSFPSFVTAIFLIILLASWLRWLPASSLIPPDANLWGAARYLVLPVLTLVLGLLAQITLHTRNSLIEVLRSDYLRVVEGSIYFSYAILVGAGWGFLGLGVQPPSPDWGLQVNDGRNFILTAWWITVFPALAISSLVLGVNLLADGLAVNKEHWANQ